MWITWTAGRSLRKARSTRSLSHSLTSVNFHSKNDHRNRWNSVLFVQKLTASGQAHMNKWICQFWNQSDLQLIQKSWTCDGWTKMDEKRGGRLERSKKFLSAHCFPSCLFFIAEVIDIVHNKIHSLLGPSNSSYEVWLVIYTKVKQMCINRNLNLSVARARIFWEN